MNEKYYFQASWLGTFVSIFGFVVECTGFAADNNEIGYIGFGILTAGTLLDLHKKK